MGEEHNLPAWRGGRPHYEVWYVTMSDGRTGHWIRYTLSAGRPPSARLWFARFDRDRPEPVLALNAGFPIERYVHEPEPFEVRVGEAVFRSGYLAGSLQGGGHEVSWDLEFQPGGVTYRPLPGPMYRGGLAPTKPFSPTVHTRFLGTVTVDGEAITVDAMPGQQGHLYGSRHAERWAWAHCGAFEGEGSRGDVVLQALTAQGRRGPLTTPFLTTVGLRWRGQWLRFFRLSRAIDYGLGVWRIDVANRRYRLTGRISADPGLMVRARYHDPDGTDRYCHNSELASSRLLLFERGEGGFEEVAELASAGTTHAEWAGRTPAPVDMAEHVDVTGEAPTPG